MKITILVEGRTERAFKPHLLRFLKGRISGPMPHIDFFPCDGRVYKEERLRKTVNALLADKKRPSDAVIALTDVYTGSGDFSDAADAKKKMRKWVGRNASFYPHAAQHDFEAWLLPFWSEIQKLAGHDRKVPAGRPEAVNHRKPPSFHISEIFRTGSGRRAYIKVRDAGRILEGQDLAYAASKCPELKAFLNTILHLAGAKPM